MHRKSVMTPRRKRHKFNGRKSTLGRKVVSWDKTTLRLIRIEMGMYADLCHANLAQDGNFEEVGLKADVLFERAKSRFPWMEKFYNDRKGDGPPLNEAIVYDRMHKQYTPPKKSGKTIYEKAGEHYENNKRLQPYQWEARKLFNSKWALTEYDCQDAIDRVDIAAMLSEDES